MATEWREQGVELRQVISRPKSDWRGPTDTSELARSHPPELKKPVA